MVIFLYALFIFVIHFWGPSLYLNCAIMNHVIKRLLNNCPIRVITLTYSVCSKIIRLRNKLDMHTNIIKVRHAILCE